MRYVVTADPTMPWEPATRIFMFLSSLPFLLNDIQASWACHPEPCPEPKGGGSEGVLPLLIETLLGIGHAFLRMLTPLGVNWTSPTLDEPEPRDAKADDACGRQEHAPRFQDARSDDQQARPEDISE
jgi:hypothetical protein